MYKKQLAELYGIHVATLMLYLKNFKIELDNLATKIKFENKTCTRRKLNRQQVEFIVVKVMQDPPEGYELKRGRLIRINE